MKFTKEDAFESLKRELTNNGRKTLRMSEKSISGISEVLMQLLEKEGKEDIGLTDFVADYIGIFETVNNDCGNFKSNFIKQWEKEHPEIQSPEDKEAPEIKEKSENPEMKVLLERIAALEKDKEDNAKKANIAQKRKDVIAKLKEKGIKDDEWVNNFLSEVNITEDLDVDAKADSWLKLYNKSQASGGNPTVPQNPQGGGTNNSDFSDLTALAKARRESQGQK